MQPLTEQKKLTRTGIWASRQALRDEVCLGGQLLLLEILGRGGVQQDVHRQLVRLVRLAAQEHLLIVQRRGPPRQLRPQAAAAGGCAVLVLPQQQDVLELLSQLVQRHLILSQMGLVVGAVFGPLLPEVLRVPRGGGAGGTVRRRAPGEVQAAVPVGAGTQ